MLIVDRSIRQTAGVLQDNESAFRQMPCWAQGFKLSPPSANLPHYADIFLLVLFPPLSYSLCHKNSPSFSKCLPTTAYKSIRPPLGANTLSCTMHAPTHILCSTHTHKIQNSPPVSLIGSLSGSHPEPSVTETRLLGDNTGPAGAV